MPPEMNWFVVLVLSCVTGGLGGLIWTFKEVLFVKKIDAGSKAMMMLLVAIALVAVGVILSFVMMSSGSRGDLETMSTLMMVLYLVIGILGLVAVFGMRRSLLRYYNSVEPIGLKLSGAMTFFFNILYFQYHFSRIAVWKKTGRLS
jgi:hypothetical protein